MYLFLIIIRKKKKKVESIQQGRSLIQYKDRNFIVMVKISEEWCHTFWSISGASFRRAPIKKKNVADSISGSDKCFL